MKLYLVRTELSMQQVYAPVVTSRGFQRQFSASSVVSSAKAGGQLVRTWSWD